MSDSDDNNRSRSNRNDDTTPYIGTRLSNSHVRATAVEKQALDVTSRMTGTPSTTAAVSAESNDRNGLRLNTNPYKGIDAPDDGVNLGMFENAGQPTVWSAVNYPREEEFEFESFYIRYVRQPEARAVINKPVNDTWKDTPNIHDAKYADSGDPQSDFEKEVKKLMSGEYTRRKPMHRLRVLDKLARLGHYAVLVFGFTDGRDMVTPVGGVSADATMDPEGLAQYQQRADANVPPDLGESEFDGADNLMYLAVFGEDRITDIETVSDMSSPRFRLPEQFDIVTEEVEPGDENSRYQSQIVHYTRALHVPEGTLEDDLAGIPALKPIFHELLNIDKIRAASGEGYWRAGYQGLHIRPPQTSQGKFMDFDDADDVEREIEEFLQNFDRTLATPAQIDSIDSTISSPVPHLDANYEAISAATDIPKSILTGQDRADTADATDLTKYERKIASRRNNYANAVIIEPFIQRLIDVGVLPEPEGDGFVIKWPSLEELTEIQEWELKLQIAQAVKTIAPGGDTSLLATVPELRQALGWNPNRGGNIDPEKLDRPQAEQDPSREPLGQGGAGEQGGDSVTSGGSGSETAPQQRGTGGPDSEQGQPDGTQGEDDSFSGFPYPDELYDSPEQARERAEELDGISGYHVRVQEGSVKYAPGPDAQAFTQALQRTDGESASAQQSQSQSQSQSPSGQESQSDAESGTDADTTTNVNGEPDRMRFS